jgi:hypothetical protein
MKSSTLNDARGINIVKDLEEKECKRCYTIWCMVCCCFFMCSTCCDEDKKETKKDIEIEMTRRV